MATIKNTFISPDGARFYVDLFAEEREEAVELGLEVYGPWYDPRSTTREPILVLTSKTARPKGADGPWEGRAVFRLPERKRDESWAARLLTGARPQRIHPIPPKK